MKIKPTSRSQFLSPRALIGAALFAVAILIAPGAAQAQGQKQEGAKLTAAEAKTMAAGLKPLLNDSAEGLVSVKHADGAAYTDLQGRFQNVTVATKDANGKVTAGCVNNTEAAAGFFGIDRKLLDLPPKAQPTQPADR
jgi:hypothetical protein